MAATHQPALDASQIRLITVDPFPDAAAIENCPAAEQLTSRCAVFENHYLQQDDWCSPVHQHADSVAATVREFRSICRTVMCSPAAQASELSSSIWQEVIPTKPVWPEADIVAAKCAHPPDAQMSWLHVVLPDDSGSAFASVIQAVDLILADAPITTLITAIRGTASILKEPFRTVIPEYSIRVPLWIYMDGRSGCSVQRLTGSSDINHTLRRALQQLPPTNAGSTESVDLREAAGAPGAAIERELRIEHQGIRALRTQEFLYAEAPSSDSQGASHDVTSALYSKPDDVWNIHDVAGEYPAVAAELADRLQATSAPSP